MSLNASIGKKRDERARAHELLNAGNDRALLKLMRDEATLLILMVRVRNQEAQDEYRARKSEQDELEAALDAPLFERN